MNFRHRKTLAAVLEIPTRAGIVFPDIEALMLALGARMAERAGSHLRVELQGEIWRCHRPPPGTEAKKYQIEGVRELLQRLRIAP